MKKYTIEVIVTEQSDEFWEEITENGKTGCDEVLDAIKDELENWNVDVKLINYKDE